MRGRVELLVNLWTFGVPVVVMVWALLRLNLPPRVRYAIAVAGFFAVLFPWWRLGDAPHPAFGHPLPALRGEGIGVADVVAGPATIAWVAIAVLLILRDLIGHLRLHWTRFDDAPIALKEALAWPANVSLVVSDHAAPFTVGLLRPSVVLPRDLAERFPMSVVQRIARHELSHARWRDPLVYALLRIVASIFWVSPAWLVLRWVRREREAAADAHALRGESGHEESYVEALLRLARPSRELAAAMAGSDLEYRARRILAPQRAPLLAVLAFALGALLFSVAAPAQFDTPDEPPIVVRSRSVIVTLAPEH